MGQLAYILAASHSGSTLLAMLLGAHPEARTVGELKAGSLGDAERYRCSCGELIRDCGFWRQVRKAMRSRGIDFDVTQAGTSLHDIQSSYARRLLEPLHRGWVLELARDAGLALSPQWSRHLRETQRRNAALVESLQALTGARIIIDSSKTALRLKYLLRNPALDVRVIRLIRDGRAVALTYMDEWSYADAADPQLRGGGSGGGGERRQRPMAEAALEWRRSNEEAECLLARLDRSRSLEVRYEEICGGTRATLERICGFLELAPEKIVPDFRSVPQHVIGNGMRLNKTSEIRLDDRWKAHLTAADLAAFESVAGPLNRRYGYV